MSTIWMEMELCIHDVWIELDAELSWMIVKYKLFLHYNSTLSFTETLIWLFKGWVELYKVISWRKRRGKYEEKGKV